MADKTGINWTEATWNPVVGCSIRSPGCRRCYAMKMGRRLELMGGKGGKKYAGLTRVVKGKSVWTGEVREHAESIDQPIRWRRPRLIFVNSMSDLFHEKLGRKAMDRTFAVMAMARQHTFQILTKREDVMVGYMEGLQNGMRGFDIVDCQREIIGEAAYFRRQKRTDGYGTGFEKPLANVWIGVSVEDQRYADVRRDALKRVAALGWKTWVSYEPALGPVDWTGWDFIRCLVSGGESGDDATPSHPNWHRSARDWCAAHGIAYGFKQWGEWAPHRARPWGDLGGDVRTGRVRIVHPSARSDVEISEATGGHSTEPGSRYMARIGKRVAGRLLDGVEHNGIPA